MPRRRKTPATHDLLQQTHAGSGVAGRHVPSFDPPAPVIKKPRSSSAERYHPRDWNARIFAYLRQRKYLPGWGDAGAVGAPGARVAMPKEEFDNVLAWVMRLDEDQRPEPQGKVVDLQEEREWKLPEE